MKRVSNAFQQRVYTDAIIRYNYLIDNMSTQDMNKLDSKHQRRLEVLATNTRKLRGLNMDALASLKMEVNDDYARTMNKIIFDKYMEDCTKEFGNIHLELPPTKTDQRAPAFGMIQMDRNAESKDLTEIFKDFCYNSLYVREEALYALQEIRLECKKCLEVKLFQVDFTHPVTIDDFKHQQDLVRTQMTRLLQNIWVNNIAKIIKNQFSEVGKGWFSIWEPNKTTYDFGKLKKFLIMVRQMMQDVLYDMVKRNYYAFYDFLVASIPTSVEVKSPQQVENTYRSVKKKASGKDEEQVPSIPH